MEKLLAVLKLAKPEVDATDFLNARDLYGQGIIDSLDIVVIVDEINAAFGLDIGAADIRREDFTTVEKLFALIKRCGGE